ncbi:MAG TPA: hypothetical protein VGC21_16610 [Telluria sp.]
MLRISGAYLDVKAMLLENPLPVEQMWVKGEPRILRGKFHVNSGVSVVVSDAEFDEFDLQAADAAQFLQLHHAAMLKIAAYPAVEEVSLDFGVAIREGYATQSSYLSPQLMQLAASAGVGILLSHYPCSDSDES